MAEASGATDNFVLLFAFFFYYRDSLWNSNFSLFAEPELSHLCLTPTIEQSFFGDGK
jgi:hypothetical protein